jgi:hypothetical protein
VADFRPFTSIKADSGLSPRILANPSAFGGAAWLQRLLRRRRSAGRI